MVNLCGYCKCKNGKDGFISCEKTYKISRMQLQDISEQMYHKGLACGRGDNSENYNDVISSALLWIEKPMDKRPTVQKHRPTLSYRLSALINKIKWWLYD